MRVKQGDIIKVNFDPTMGSEQGGYRPGLVVSNDFTISKTNIIAIVPITNTLSRHPFNVFLDGKTTGATTGVVECAHIRSVDLIARNFYVSDRILDEKLDEVLEVVFAMLDN